MKQQTNVYRNKNVVLVRLILYKQLKEFVKSKMLIVKDVTEIIYLNVKFVQKAIS